MEVDLEMRASFVSVDIIATLARFLRDIYYSKLGAFNRVQNFPSYIQCDAINWEQFLRR